MINELETNVMIKQQSAAIELLFTHLTDKQEDVVKKRFGFEGPKMTFKAIGEIYGVSCERVRQIEAKSLRVIKNKIRTGKFKHCIFQTNNPLFT